MDRQKQQGPQVERCLFPQQIVRVDGGGHDLFELLRLVREAAQDAPFQEVPERGNADDTAHVTSAKLAVEALTRDFGQISDLRATTERQKKARRELERVMERQNAQHAVFMREVVDREKLRDETREVPVREHHAFRIPGRA